MNIDMTTEKRFESALCSLEPLWDFAYDEGVQRDVSLPNATLKDCILTTVARRMDETHIVYKSQRLTYEQTNRAACQLANAFSAAGFSKGDSVIIMLGDTPQLIEAFMACYKIGLVAVGLNPRSTSDEFEKRAQDCSAKVVVAAHGIAGRLAKRIVQASLEIGSLIIVDDDAGTRLGAEDLVDVSPAGLLSESVCCCEAWDDVLDASDDSEPVSDVSPDDVAMLIYTGGTTGVPKGCPLTNRMLIWAEYYFFSFMRPRLRVARNMTSLLTSPMTHAYGMDFGVNWGIVIGGTVVIADSLDGRRIAELVRENHVTVWGAVPAMLGALCAQIEHEGADVSSLEVVVVSCAATSTEVLRKFKALNPGVSLIEDYGMTETSGPVTLIPVGKSAPVGSVGVPVENTDILVVDLPTGEKPLNANERGEIVFRGPQIIDGYWKMPGETDMAFRGEWIHSGDVGYFDENGYLYVVDRIKDVIEVSGFSVFPREIDELLFAHPAIVDACTVGVPDERSGERPKSFVVLAPGQTVTEEEIVSYCHEHLIAYKCPKRVEFIGAIPLTSMGKPDKKALRERERERLKEVSAS